MQWWAADSSNDKKCICGINEALYYKILFNSITITYIKILYNIVYCYYYVRSAWQDRLIATDVNNAMF